MSWIFNSAGSLVVGFLGSWFFFRWQNQRKLSVAVAARGQMANCPLPTAETYIVSVTATNCANKPVKIKQCYFIVDGQAVQIALIRENTLTLRQGFPCVLEPDEQCCVGYPAEPFLKHRVERIYVEDFRGKRWFAPRRQVRALTSDIKDLRGGLAA